MDTQLRRDADAAARPDRGRSWRRVTATALLVVVGGLVIVLLVGNLTILGATRWARSHVDSTAPAPAGVDNFEMVNQRVSRGAAPTPLGYRSLAALGVDMVIDLRAEENLHVDDAALRRLGITRVHVPVRDGQAPAEAEVRRVLDVVLAHPGQKIFIHCGAGVGRTGTMAAAYLVATGEADAAEALRRNLAVGPPSLEQVAFVAKLGGARAERPAPALVAVSRALDAPRRLWSRLS